MGTECNPSVKKRNECNARDQFHGYGSSGLSGLSRSLSGKKKSPRCIPGRFPSEKCSPDAFCLAARESRSSASSPRICLIAFSRRLLVLASGWVFFCLMVYRIALIPSRIENGRSRRWARCRKSTQIVSTSSSQNGKL